MKPRIIKSIKAESYTKSIKLHFLNLILNYSVLSNFKSYLQINQSVGTHFLISPGS